MNTENKVLIKDRYLTNVRLSLSILTFYIDNKTSSSIEM